MAADDALAKRIEGLEKKMAVVADWAAAVEKHFREILAIISGTTPTDKAAIEFGLATINLLNELGRQPDTQASQN